MTKDDLLARVEVMRLRAAEDPRDEVPSPERRPALAEAIARGERGMARAVAGADPDWVHHAELLIRAMPIGRQFLAEQVTAQLVDDHYFTESPRALGAIVRRLSKEGVIFATGEYRRARSSNGTLKTLWQRS